MELTIDEALRQGITAHRDGNIQEADRLYTAILGVHPKHPDANHNLGVLAVSVGKVDIALPFFKTALESNPKIEQFWLSYIDALIRLGEFDGARQVLDQGRGSGLKGDKVDQLENQLSNSASSSFPAVGDMIKAKIESLIALYHQERFDECLLQGKTLASEFPNDPAIPNILGVVCKALGRYEESIIHYNKAINLKPDYAEAYYNLGNILRFIGKNDEAFECSKKIMEIRPWSIIGSFSLNQKFEIKSSS